MQPQCPPCIVYVPVPVVVPHALFTTAPSLASSPRVPGTPAPSPVSFRDCSLTSGAPSTVPTRPPTPQHSDLFDRLDAGSGCSTPGTTSLLPCTTPASPRLAPLGDPGLGSLLGQSCGEAPLPSLPHRPLSLEARLEEDSAPAPGAGEIAARVALYLKKQQRLSGYVDAVEYTDVSESRGHGVVMTKALPGVRLRFSCRSIAQESRDLGRVAAPTDACEFKLSDRGGLRATSIRLKRRRPAPVGTAAVAAPVQNDPCCLLLALSPADSMHSA